MDMVRWLNDLTRSDLATAGGKGCNLGEMMQAGLPVPQGFVVTTEAYWAFVQENDLLETIRRSTSGVLPEDPSALETASRIIRTAFEAGQVSHSIRQSVVQAYDRLGNGPVAVRSSATAEDLPAASFAGQQETYLHRLGIDDIMAAIRMCWGSLWTARAIAYRARQGISPRDVSMAVVVQEMVPAEAAGVLFTANPVNGRRDQMVINAAWGLGEAVVSGQVNPDQWVVNTGGTVVEERIAQKQAMTMEVSGGTSTVPVPEHKQGQPTLNPAQIAGLAELGRRVHAHFGSPQDTEWALAKGNLFLVQSRPITSLFPIPQPAPDPSEGLRVCVCHTLIQGIPEPFTPMGLSLLAELQRSNRAINGAQLEPRGVPVILKTAAGRLFIDVTDTLRHSLLGPKLQFILGQVEPGTAAILRQLVEREPGLSYRKQGFPGAPMSFGQALGVMAEMVKAMVWPDRARRDAEAKIDEAFKATALEGQNVQGALEAHAFAVRAMASVRDLLLPLFAPLGVGMLGLEGAQRLIARWLGNDQALDPAMRSLPNNPTTEMGLQLWRVSRRLRADGVQPDPHHPAVRAFLTRYGHRALRELDVGIPRWSEDPVYVLTVLNTYLGHGDEADAERRFHEGEAEAETATAALIARIRRERGRLQAWALRRLLFWMRSYGGLRESPKYHTIRLIAMVRKALQKAGAVLASEGLLDHRDEVFWLYLDELGPSNRSGLDLRQLVVSRKNEYERELARRHVPRVVTSTGETLYEPMPATAQAPTAVPCLQRMPELCSDGVMRGTPASPGVCEGKVRVILQPRGARLEPGEILVAPGTDPAWTPLFLTAGALVTETGGAMSHGAVVAREFGVPAVVGLMGAVKSLKTGQRVKVDGGAGTVTLLP